MRFTTETLKRTVRTFLQAAISYIVVNAVAIDFTSGEEVVKSALLGLIVAAIAAGLAAVMNLETTNRDENYESEVK